MIKMKRILFLLYILTVSVILYGQSGDGKTPGTAYYGTISTSQTWTFAYNNGIIYVGQTSNEDLIIGTGGLLTIRPGVTVIFCKTTSDLIITGTGSLTADGKSDSTIKFTRYYPTNNYWGHIIFQSMGSAGSSLFDYCIIEYGDVTAFANNDPHGAGGGLHLNFNSVTVTNCIFQHNRSQWGGGIFVYSDKSPSIRNCYFYDNFAKESGGGMYLWDRSGSVVENCIFYSNSCQGYSLAIYTGGGLGAQSNTSAKVVNCTFANNTSSRIDGQGLMLYNSSNARVVNTILWGSSNQAYLYGTSGSTIINCAIQASVPSGSSNCIVLNSSNSAADGPNFVATDGSDWSIKFISPCRDKGVDSYAGVTIPVTDYKGNSRIYTTDMGTYEVQYSRWATTPFDNLDWTSPLNWVQGLYPGSSGSTGDILIPLLSGSSSAPDIGGSVYINSGKYMILEPGAMATLSSLTNNGTLILQSDANHISSLITDTYAGNPATIELYLTGGGTKTTYKWHFISSPVTSLAVSTFSPTYTLDLAQYVESRPTSSTREGWVAYDGYIYSTGGMGGPTFSTLAVGKGYDYYKSTALKYTFPGQLNTGDVTVTLGFSGDTALNGFNLIGNPYSSGLNWDDVIAGVYYSFPANTSKSLYFTRNNVQCSYIKGVGIPVDVTGIIPPMQGFFSKTYTPGNSISFSGTSRVHDAIHPRYKGQTIIPLVRLVLNEDSLSDETVVRFNNQAKPGRDNDYDAIKFGVDPEMPAIYTISQGNKFAINGQPFPSSSPPSTVDIPVSLNLVSDTSINYFKVTQLQGLDNYDVQLIDNVSGQVTNLKTTDSVDFTSQKGSVSGRFILRFSYVVTGIENPVSSNQIFNIYPANGLLNILTLSDIWDSKTGSVRVVDLTGKTISYLTDKEFNKNLLVQIQAPSANGVYLVELKSGPLRYVGKVVIR